VTAPLTEDSYTPFPLGERTAASVL